MRIRPPAFAAPAGPAAPAAAPAADDTFRQALAHCVALRPLDPDETPAPASRRADGWTCDRQRTFLEALAEGTTVEAAARLVGLSPASAYAFRQRAHGAAFALGWHAALLLQRQKLADTLTSRAFDGQVDTYTRADGTEVTRHRHDNRLGLALLTRLDRLAAQEGAADRHGEAQAARIVAGEWQRYLDLVAGEGGAARAALFLAARAAPAVAAEAPAGDAAADPLAALAPVLALARADLYLRARVGDAAAVDCTDLDPAARAGWTADQWCRAEAAGLVALAPPPPREEPAPEPQQSQHSPAPDAPSAGNDPVRDDPGGYDPEEGDDQVWWDDDLGEWRTAFPPPPGADCDEEGDWRDDDYHRSLTVEEEVLVEVPRLAARAAARLAADADRRAWFAARAGAGDPDDAG